MVKNSDKIKNDHHMVHGNMFYDEYDMYDSTVHQIITKDDQIVASNRIVDGRSVELEMEKYNWFDIRKHIESDNLAEPGRLVADKSIRRSNLVPLMYIETLDYFIKNNIEFCTPMVNSKATKLIKHYTDWTGVDKVNTDPIKVNQFLEGQESDVFLLKIGKEVSMERKRLLYTNYIPANLIYSVM